MVPSFERKGQVGHLLTKSMKQKICQGHEVCRAGTGICHFWQGWTHQVPTSLWGLLVSVALKSASHLRTHFLSQKTQQHLCLHFRKTLPSIQEPELLKQPPTRKKNRKWSVGLLRTSHGGFLLWKTPNCYFGFKIVTAVFGGVIFFFGCSFNICFF